MISAGQRCVTSGQDNTCLCNHSWCGPVSRSDMAATCQASTSGRVHADYGADRNSRLFYRKSQATPMCACVGLITGSRVSRKGTCGSLQHVYAVPLQLGINAANSPVNRISSIETNYLGPCTVCTASASAAGEVGFAQP